MNRHIFKIGDILLKEHINVFDKHLKEKFGLEILWKVTKLGDEEGSIWIENGCRNGYGYLVNESRFKKATEQELAALKMKTIFQK